MTPPVIVGTTTWNSADIIDLFLQHYERLGAQAVLVVDYHSTDGTREILTSARWRGFVRMFDLPSLAGQDTSNQLLGVARASFGDAWCLFCDPDEFLVTPAMSLRDPALASVWDAAQIVTVPRFNMTAPRSAALGLQGSAGALAALTLRIDRRAQRKLADFGAQVLDPPWIFTAILGKVCVRVRDARRVGDGDHVATVADPKATAALPGSCLLHYPFRSYALFEEKVRQATLDFAANDYGVGNSWQYRRWIRIAQRGGLHEEYLEQFVPDDAVAARIADGTLTEDVRVRDMLSRPAPA